MYFKTNNFMRFAMDADSSASLVKYKSFKQSNKAYKNKEVVNEFV